MTTNIQRISDAEYAAALAAGRTEAESKFGRKLFATSPSGMPSRSSRTTMLAS